MITGVNIKKQKILNLSISKSRIRFEPEAISLIARMDTLGELPSTEQQNNINYTIKSLKNYCLFDRRFECLYVGRGYGEQSTKLNWIKDAHNLTTAGAGTITFQEGIGYNNDGNSYLRTNFIPPTDAVNMTVDNFGVFSKFGGAFGNMAARASTLFGASNTLTTCDFYISYSFGNKLIAMNSGVVVASEFPVIGYNSGGRGHYGEFWEYKNSNSYKKTDTHAFWTTLEPYILAWHYFDGSAIRICESTLIWEILAMGCFFSHSENLILQTIFNKYIARL